MAKLASHFGLCPLIDHKSLLGITEGPQNGSIIVTLGRNIAIQFNVADQRQLQSWRSKEKLTAPIVYNRKLEQFIAVFNDNFLRMWQDGAIYNEKLLDKVKRIKFDDEIRTLLSCANDTLVVFENGNILPLTDCLSRRKLKEMNFVEVLRADEHICDVLSIEHENFIYIGLLLEEEDFIWTRFNLDTCQLDEYARNKIATADDELKGWCLHADEIVQLLTLRSDGKLHKHILGSEVNEEWPDGAELIADINSISCKSYVSMISLDSNYIALYGNERNEEGALLSIYNIQFKVPQCQQPFKMFTNGAKMYKIDRKLLLPVGQNLAVVPFCLDGEQLAALVGTRIIELDKDPDVEIISDHLKQMKWSDLIEDAKLVPNVPETLVPLVANWLQEGICDVYLTQYIFEQILNDKYDDMVVLDALKYFYDIPEALLVSILKKAVRHDHVDALDLIFTKSFNDAIILAHIKSQLELIEVIFLLYYLDSHFNSDDSEISDEQIIQWLSIILDANYQKLLLSRDKDIMCLVAKLQQSVTKRLKETEYITTITSHLNGFMFKSKESAVGSNTHSLAYCIETFKLY